MSSEAALVQIDPGRALCWEQDETIRIGFDLGHVRVASPSPEVQRVFQTLVRGMSEDDFLALTRHPGSGSDDIRDLVNTLKPVLVRRTPGRAGSHPTRSSHPSAVRTVLHDDGRELPGLRAALEANWLCNIERSSAPPELAVQVLRFLEPLERTRRWLGAGIPHLIIRLTDDAIRVGPLVSPDGGPCHSCEVMHLIDADAALPKLAVQLLGRTPGSESASNGQLVGAIAAQVVRAWKNGAQWVHSSQIVLPISKRQISGLATKHTVVPHPECGCSLGAHSEAEIAGDAEDQRSSPTSLTNLEGAREERAALANPEMSSSSRARVNAT